MHEFYLRLPGPACTSFNRDFCVLLQDSNFGPYDAVVIATPLEGSDISVHAPNIPPLPPREYQSTITTILKGKLDLGYFGSSPKPAGKLHRYLRKIETYHMNEKRM